MEREINDMNSEIDSDVYELAMSGHYGQAAGQLGDNVLSISLDDVLTQLAIDDCLEKTGDCAGSSCCLGLCIAFICAYVIFGVDRVDDFCFDTGNYDKCCNCVEKCSSCFCKKCF